jgi:hypothetical protein
MYGDQDELNADVMTPALEECAALDEELGQLAHKAAGNSKLAPLLRAGLDRRAELASLNAEIPWPTDSPGLQRLRRRLAARKSRASSLEARIASLRGIAGAVAKPAMEHALDALDGAITSLVGEIRERESRLDAYVG